jgi:hypothetical protein
MATCRTNCSVWAAGLQRACCVNSSYVLLTVLVLVVCLFSAYCVECVEHWVEACQLAIHIHPHLQRQQTQRCFCLAVGAAQCLQPKCTCICVPLAHTDKPTVICVSATHVACPARLDEGLQPSCSYEQFQERITTCIAGALLGIQHNSS